MTIESYCEEGSTTTPFDMVLRNHCSRYDVAEAAERGGAKSNARVLLDLHKALGLIRHDVAKAKQCIMATGKAE